jgi:EmrB/QacA subfamily drug resistance transporter
MSLEGRKRWLALYVLCLGDLMIVLDGTIVNVALPSIRADLGFSQTSLAWVVNAYLLTFGGFLLLGGRLGDLFGHRRLFLVGISIFTLASLGCGLANSQDFLVGARAVQGIGGAIVSAVALSLLMTLFTETADRAKAMGVFGFVLSGGGVIGVLAGGILTDVLNWHWIFLVNLPVGVLVYVLSLRLLPTGRGQAPSGRRVDVAGAITVTASLMLGVYAIVNGNEEGWTSTQTLGLLSGAVALLAVFLAIEARISFPLVPLGLFRNRNFSAANLVGVLMAAGMFAYFFFSALYLQLVLGYSPLEVGLAYLPGTVIWGASSLLLSDRLVMRFGIKTPLMKGMALMVAALLLLARVPVEGNFLVDVLPATIAIGLGAGIAFNPILLAAMSGVAPTEAGLASGVVNTAFMMGGALGLAILASLADSRTVSLAADGARLTALNGGYHLAFLVGAVFLAAAASVVAALLRIESAPAHAGQDAAAAPEGASAQSAASEEAA